MSKFKVLVSQAHNVLHLARLVKQASADSTNLYNWGSGFENNAII